MQSIKDIKLSPRERKLLSVVKRRSSWVTSHEVTVALFGAPSGWTMNARMCATVGMRSLQKKLAFQNAEIKISRRGGGRGGTEYRAEKV